MKRSRSILALALLVLLVLVWWYRTRSPDERTVPGDVSPDMGRTEAAARLDADTVAAPDTSLTGLDFGRWRVARNPDQPLSEEDLDRFARLKTLPYLQGYKLAPEARNVVVYDPDHAWDGLNVYTSGHRPESFVMDMEGEVIHAWHLPIEAVWDDIPKRHRSRFWRRVHWFPNGDILAIFDNIGMIKLDRRSNVIWANRTPVHHDIFVAPDGTIYTLTHRPQMIPRINRVDEVLPDNLALISPDGELLREIPLLECLENSRYKQLLRRMIPNQDFFHTNSVFVFDGSMAHLSPHFREGLVMVSILRLDVIAIIDIDNEEAVWAIGSVGDVKYHKQHDPQLLPSGNMLLFDNRGANGKSRILEFDPLRLEVVWEYVGSEYEEFYSMAAGTVSRVPNGNTLITESDNGRAFEVTPDGKIVWEFLNPHRAGEDDELIATIFELERVDRDFFPWLDADAQTSP